MQGRGKRKYPEKTRRQVPSSSMIPTCENLGANPPGIEPGSSRHYCNNHATVARFVNDGLKVLWPDGIQEEKVLVLYSDAASYMLKAATALSAFHVNIIHFTCLAHGLQRIAEEVRSSYPQVNNSFINQESVSQSSISLPGTIAKCSIVPLSSTNEVGARGTNCIQRTKIKCALAYIHNNFSFIAASIKKLENIGLSLRMALDVVEECNSKLIDVRGDIGQKVLNKFEAVLVRNSGHKNVVSICKILDGEEENPPVDISPGKYHICLNLHHPLPVMSRGRFPLTKTFYRTSDIP
ncbi:hypothetical protein PR048_030369 [Dryococelus australis]|uniref:DUF659 domain-containing protein n=1 Tax=Dryococelus australis TaxID=614101 RepID=A0ABQ9GBM9_9NEOP|nr:hypothetical protein PR048_030369 [Dryococelus australis]